MVHRGDLVVVGVSVGLTLGILIALLAVFALKWCRKRANSRRCANETGITTLPRRVNGRTTNSNSFISQSDSGTLPGPEHKQRSVWWNHHNKAQLTTVSAIPKYSYKDIQKATQNFTTLLGEGAFGPVYKAITHDGGIAAVKVLASGSKQGEKEFQTETNSEAATLAANSIIVSLLGRLHHRNLVNLVGYCVDKGQHMLIYEFMNNGSLENLLYGEETRVLTWEERLQIALDISHGIEYLHEGAVPPVIHRDLKSANILLDHSMSAKVADFGLSKEMVFDGRNSGLKGTYGYMDPAYISTNKFTMKSDIYSFGVIIFELITAIHPQQNLMEYVNLASMSQDGIDEILDQRLVGTCNITEVRDLAKLAHRCVHNSPRKRPCIGEATQAIVRIKQRRRGRTETMSSINGEELSRVLSRIEDQHVELSMLAGVREDA